MTAPAIAATFKSVFEFNGTNGAYPTPGVTKDPSANVYFGATFNGGSTVNCTTGCGVVYSLTPKAVGFWTHRYVHKFAGGNDGYIPYRVEFLDGPDTLYGVADVGGSQNCTSGCGLAFSLARPAIASALWPKTLLHSFLGPTNDGEHPLSSLSLASSGALLGMTVRGGNTPMGGSCVTFRDGCGTLYELLPPATGTLRPRKILHNFSGGLDGALPSAVGLIKGANGNFYGYTNAGGNMNCQSPYQGAQTGCGVIFKLTPKGTGFTYTVIYRFANTLTNGNTPTGTYLTLDAGGKLYGTTAFGGQHHLGTVFQLTAPATGTLWHLTILHSFTGKDDGKQPSGGVVFDANGNLYGTASAGGSTTNCSQGCGTIFKLEPGSPKWTFTVLRKFNGTDGNTPLGPMIRNGGTLIGVTRNGGKFKNCKDIYQVTAGCGNVFTLVP